MWDMCIRVLIMYVRRVHVYASRVYTYVCSINMYLYMNMCRVYKHDRWFEPTPVEHAACHEGAVPQHVATPQDSYSHVLMRIADTTTLCKVSACAVCRVLCTCGA